MRLLPRSTIVAATILFAASIILAAVPVTAATIYESGTLGPTGIPRSDIADEIVAGTNISPDVFTGVRIFFDQPVITTQIGGHFVKNTGADESFFGAIIALDNESDFPDSGDLSTPDVLGSTSLVFPEPSDEVFGDLDLTLAPGWYALVFGSGLFDATGRGVAVRNGVDIGDPSYIAYVSSRWRNLEGTSIPFENHRFVVSGTIVPEPSSAAFVLFASLYVIIKRPRC